MNIHHFSTLKIKLQAPESYLTQSASGKVMMAGRILRVVTHKKKQYKEAKDSACRSQQNKIHFMNDHPYGDDVFFA